MLKRTLLIIGIAAAAVLLAPPAAGAQAPAEPFTLNDRAWALFLRSNDQDSLNVAITWMERVVRTPDRTGAWAGFVDTYANLLFKVGRLDEAIQWQEQAVAAADDAGFKAGLVKTLEKMKRGEITWPQIPLGASVGPGVSENAFTNGTGTQLPGSAQASKRASSGSSQSAACTRDEFAASSLNRALWNTVVREDGNVRVENGYLVIPTSNTDLWPAGGTTSNIVLQPVPTSPFTATAKLAVAPRSPWQQAGLIIYSDDDNYAKVVLGARSSSRNVRRIEFLREENGSAAGNMSAPLEETHPDTIYVRFTRDSTLHASYSSDGKTFTEIPATKPIPTFANAKIGLLSLGGDGERPIIDAKFDWFEVCRLAPTLGSRP